MAVTSIVAGGYDKVRGRVQSARMQRRGAVGFPWFRCWATRSPVAVLSIFGEPFSPDEDGWDTVKCARSYWLFLTRGNLNKRRFGASQNEIAA
jgi:hypothetical protein